MTMPKPESFNPIVAHLDLYRQYLASVVAGDETPFITELDNKSSYELAAALQGSFIEKLHSSMIKIGIFANSNPYDLENKPAISAILAETEAILAAVYKMQQEAALDPDKA